MPNSEVPEKNKFCCLQGLHSCDGQHVLIAADMIQVLQETVFFSLFLYCCLCV